jgi:hypothetical protein
VSSAVENCCEALSLTESTGDSIPSGITSTFELSVGIFAASFPTYRPLYRILFKSKNGETTAPTGGYGSGQSFPRKWNKVQDRDSRRILKMTTIRSETQPREADEERLYVLGSEHDITRIGSSLNSGVP